MVNSSRVCAPSEPTQLLLLMKEDPYRRNWIFSSSVFTTAFRSNIFVGSSGAQQAKNYFQVCTRHSVIALGTGSPCPQYLDLLYLAYSFFELRKEIQYLHTNAPTKSLRYDLYSVKFSIDTVYSIYLSFFQIIPMNF